MNLTVESVSNDNLAAMAAMMVKLWPDSTFIEEIDSVRSLFQTPGHTGFLAKSADQYVGFIQLSLRHDYVEGTSTSPVAYIEGLFVEEDYRGRGIGSALVREGEIWALRQGCKEMGSDTYADNQDSIGFHRAMGFRKSAPIICFYKKIGL